MGWITTFLLTLVVIFVLVNACIGSEHEEIQEDLESRANPRLPSWAKRYTKKTSGCPCWWDLTKTNNNCACCKSRGIQCGYPLHRFCQKDSRKPQYRIGCPGSYYCEFLKAYLSGNYFLALMKF